VVGVNPGNPEAEVSSCGFFPHGVAGGMLAYLTESQTLIPNRRVAVATDPHARGWFMINYSQLCCGGYGVGNGAARSGGVEVKLTRLRPGTTCYALIGLDASSLASLHLLL
jgi:hypothetical protein